MKRFLYLSPYFPPQSRVGALRPLKFARWLPAEGWEPVVVCDLSPGDAVDPDLAAAVPDGVTVVRTWSRRAARTAMARPVEATGIRTVDGGPRATARRLAARVAPHPETLPLGAHLLDIPHARRAVRRALDAAPDCRAVVVNADPHAALLVGRSLAADTGLPLVVDLRDPWAPCQLRRPHRPPPQRALVDRLERSVVTAAERVILNTETSLADYRHHYRDLDPDRFAVIRNCADPALIGDGADIESGPGPEGPVSLLFLGNFRRDVGGDGLLRMVAELARRDREVQLVVTGRIGDAERRRAAELGISGALRQGRPVPYRRVGAAMAGAGVLVAIGHHGHQRIPAKIYDYLTSDRPMLVMSDNEELVRLLDDMPGAWVVGLDDSVGAADRVGRIIDAGVDTRYQRSIAGLDAPSAAGALARILDDVTGGEAQ